MSPISHDRLWQSATGPVRSACPDFGIMAIVNLTPDSFYDGGRIKTEGELLDKVSRLSREGADILDLGAESSRPGAKTVPLEQELARLIPALELIRENFPQAQISVDTRKAKAARKSLELGATIINDVSGLRHDPELLEVLGDFRPAYVLTHGGENPEYMPTCVKFRNVVEEICLFFEKGLEKLLKAGLPESHTLLDPGIGFGKNLEQNLEIIKNISRFAIFDRPLLIGVSMKSLFQGLLGHSLEKRACDSAVASALCWNKGVFWHRVHDVERTRSALLCALAFQAA